MGPHSYRPDIDGLRAVAVSSVVAYHVSSGLLPGGYLGVDIFFVLSGFLITSIIWAEMDEGQFAIARFYERRIRRIMPALLTVLAVTSIAATLLLLPADLIGYSKSLLATLAFAANVYFWRDTDYFARAAAEKPLLHMWSLGIEEQFYVLFPLLLMLVSALFRRGALAVVVATAAGSLAIDVALLSAGGGSPAFFLLPSRAWELGAGSIVALLPPGLARGRAGWTRCGLAALGAFLVLWSLFAPGPHVPRLPVALPAVGGAALLVAAGVGGTTPVGRLLSLAPMVLLGQISYSLYLWHWPVLVFVRYYLVRDLAPWEAAAAVCLAVGLAYLSWRFVERPFRGRTMAYGRVLAWTGAGVGTTLAVAAVLIATAGLPDRLPAEAARINAAVGTNYRCPITGFIAFGGSRACLLDAASAKLDDVRIVLYGNSHAQMYAPLVRQIAGDLGGKPLLVPMNGCLPTVSVNLSPDFVAMARTNLTEILKLPAVKTVIVGLTWDHETTGLWDAASGATMRPALPKLVAALDDLADKIEASGRSVVLIGPIAYPGWDIASVLSRDLAFGWPTSRPLGTPQPDFAAQYAAAIAHFEARFGDRFVRADRSLCDAGTCHFILDGKSLFADESHIAEAALTRFRAPFETAMRASFVGR